MTTADGVPAAGAAMAAKAVNISDTGFGKVRFTTDLEGLYRCLLGLRTADRLLLETAFFQAEDFDALFDGTKAVSWEAYIPKGMGLRVSKVRTNRSKLSAETSIQAIVHKAAAERLCTMYKTERLSENGPVAELRVYIEKDKVSLLLDLSGEPLFKRGYRKEGGIAPLRETTAAAILLLANWRRKFPLYDPFCGSGTILIEAAMYAWDMAPGLGRRFALDGLLIADEELDYAVRRDLLGRINFERTIRIYGSDSDARAAAIAKSNAERAYDIACSRTPVPGMSASQPNKIHLPFLPDIRALPMEEARSPDEETGFIITNPPYGKRLGEPGDAERIYERMPVLSLNFPGWKLAVITDHPGFESFFGKKAGSCREITNGAIPSYFFQYEGL
ncbi:MAG: class I SAM-dependent RNA methyltransferase [Treponema sp.]|nr:class I SAM-dependent RNA methyltransferase [Treponema sp.]